MSVQTTDYLIYFFTAINDAPGERPVETIPLSTEQRSHRYRCQFCGMTFGFQSFLDRHTLKHTGSKPFACHLCEKSFTRKSTLRAHILKEHRHLMEQLN